MILKTQKNSFNIIEITSQCGIVIALVAVFIFILICVIHGWYCVTATKAKKSDEIVKKDVKKMKNVELLSVIISKHETRL